MELSPNSKQQRNSILTKGFGGLTQWDNLKSWHVRQEALLIQSSPTKNQGNPGENEHLMGFNSQSQQMSNFGANFMSLLISNKVSLEDEIDQKESTKFRDSQPNVRTTSNAHHLDLSMIPELDEDTRTTVDLVTSDDETTPTPSPRAENVPKLPLSIPPLKIMPSSQSKSELQRAPPTDKPPERKRPQLNSKFTESSQVTANPKPNENKRPTKPFLRRGQGLARFNLRPEDMLKPYRNGNKNLEAGAKKPLPKPKTAKPAIRLKQPADYSFALSSLQFKKDPPKNSQQDFTAQWANPESSANTARFANHESSINTASSAKLKGSANSGSFANPENFTTWSHLLAQESDEENLEDERRNMVAGLTGVHRMQENKVRQNLLGSPKRTGTLRSAGRVQEEDEESLAAYIALEQHVGDVSFCSTSSTVDRLVAKSSRFHVTCSPRRQNRSKHDETEERRKLPSDAGDAPPIANPGINDDTSSSGWEAEEEELKRRRTSQFTSGGIKVVQVAEDESISESDPESDVESDSAEEENTYSTAPINPVKAVDFAPINNPCDTSTASIDLIIENINRKVEEHLSRLSVEIETLQKSNVTAKNQVKSLKKQVRKLEQKLATEHLAYERKLAEQRNEFTRALSEEKAKTAKEKANFERFCREQKKKEPSPVLVDQLERLRSDMISKEEKWRAERARVRGIECNLRIQITNLRQENEKLKNENNRLKREKETAANAAKAKNVSNTKVINAIAQQLSKAKSQVTVTKVTKAPSGKLPVLQEDPSSKNKKSASAFVPKPSQVLITPQPTIGVFPSAEAQPIGNGEWSSSEEEIDLGPETPEKLEEEIEKAVCKGGVGRLEDCIPSTAESLTESVIQETEAKYKAFFEDKDNAVYNVPKGKTDPCSAKNLIVHPDGSVERKKSNGTSILTLPDGTQKRQDKNGSVMTVPPSGWPISVSYFNGDKHERHENGTDHYFYAKTQAWQITHPDGRKELHLPNGVVGDKKADGLRTVAIPTETVIADNLASTGGQDSNEKGSLKETIVILPNGDQEIRTKNYVERRFQDGTVRFLYNDGLQKTLYTSGRIRVKDKNGKLLMDTASSGPR